MQCKHSAAMCMYMHSSCTCQGQSPGLYAMPGPASMLMNYTHSHTPAPYLVLGKTC
jgi:hypothetical protein